MEEEQICSVCGAASVLRQNRKGHFFWGCSQFPRCRHTTSFEVADAEDVALESDEGVHGESEALQEVITRTPSFHAGDMVCVDGGGEIWSVVDVRESTVYLEVMESSGVLRERAVSIDRLGRQEPEQGQGCFARIDGNWVEGRIHTKHNQPEQVRWNVLMEEKAHLVSGDVLRFVANDFRRDPAEALANWVVDKPGHFELRRRFLDELDTQRRLSGGCTALLASKVEVYEHQIEIVARVLEDPIHRFILADEVGLGKTIEAGLILRQRFLDGLARQALVLVPDHLKGQWESELQGRFGLRAPRVEVQTFSWLTEAAPELDPEAWTDLVVDEAHHAAAWGLAAKDSDRSRFECLARMADHAEGLLLLSATPQETTPERLLALLELLDPDVHARDGLEQFQKRIDLRETVLFVLRMIENEESSIFYADELRTIAEGVDADSPLHDLLGSIADAADEGIEPDPQQVAEVRTQFRETFRLHNRLVRSSRLSERLIAWRAPNEGVNHSRHLAEMLRAPRRVEQQANLEETVLDWRLRALQNGVDARISGTIVSCGLFAACMGAEAMKVWGAMRRGVADGLEAKRLFGQDGLDAAAALPMAAWEEGILEDLEERVSGEAWFRSKARSARDAVLELAYTGKEPGHVVVFTSTAGAAEALAEFLEGEFDKEHAGEFEVLVLGADADEHEVMDVSGDLNRDPKEVIRIVCASPRVEEGANLQGAHRVVHFDLPRNLPSLEQRIGRVDRIGQTRTLQQALLLPSATSSRASEFIQEVLSAFGVLSESISGVQGRSEDHLALLDRAHQLEELDAAAICEQVRKELDEERRARARERELDAAASAGWRVGVDIPGLVEHEKAVSLLQDTSRRPLEKFIGIHHDRRGPVGSYMRAKHATVVLGDAEEKRLSPLIGNMVMPAAGTFDRREAVRDPALALRRVGDPLLDWAAKFFRTSGRGAAYALVREVNPIFWKKAREFAGWEDFHACWVFSYAVEPGGLTEVTTDQVRVRRYMPPRTALAMVREEDPRHAVRVSWADEGFAEEDLLSRPPAPPLAWFNLQQQPYKDSKITPKELPLSDRALNSENRELLAPFLSLHGWAERVSSRSERAMRALESSDLLRDWTLSAVEGFQRASEEHERILRMRRRGQPDLEVEARARVIRALTSPTVTLRSAGFVLLTGAGH